MFHKNAGYFIYYHCDGDVVKPNAFVRNQTSFYAMSLTIKSFIIFIARYYFGLIFKTMVTFTSVQQH